MNILYINHYAGGPQFGMEFRPYHLSQRWVKSGHEVTVVSASFSHCRHRQPDVQSGPATQMIDGIRYLWLPTPHYSGSGVGRARNMAAGLPVVASNFPVWRRLLSGTDCALFVDPSDTGAVVDAVRWLLEHPEEAEAMGRRGQEAVRERFN